MSSTLWFILGIVLGLVVGGVSVYLLASARTRRLRKDLRLESFGAVGRRMIDKTTLMTGEVMVREESRGRGGGVKAAMDAAPQPVSPLPEGIPAGAADEAAPDWLAELSPGPAEEAAPQPSGDVPDRLAAEPATAGDDARWQVEDAAEGPQAAAAMEAAEKAREEFHRLVEDIKERSAAHALQPAYAEPESASPPAPSDLVHFSVTSLPGVLAGSSFLLDVWAHLDTQREEMLRRAREELGSEKIAARTKGPVKVKRGTQLIISAEIEGMRIDEPVGSIDWEGEIGKADFFVDVPGDARPGTRKGMVKVYVEELPLVEIKFLVTVGEAAAEAQSLPVEIRRIKSAFASYSSKDRVEVFERIQGIHKVAPDLDVFVDVDSLRSGDDWEGELWKQIMDRDVFFLFWSANALNSKWVEKEWRFALEKRGLEFIDPVPLVPPDEAPPPQELSGKHFNDKELIYIRAYSRK